MLLAVDIGNTNVVVALFAGEEIVFSGRLQTRRQQLVPEWAELILSLLQYRGFDPKTVSGAVISSVVPPLTEVFVEMFASYFKLSALVIEPGIKIGIINGYENPHALGSDRLVNVVAAWHYYGAPAIVVDFGTATKFEALSADGEYLGGAIAPGIKIAAEALFANASRLPVVDLQAPARVIGRNITTSVQAGVVYGYAGMVEEMVKRFRPVLAPDNQRVRVIATGGLAPIVTQAAGRVIDTVDPHLTLRGLHWLYQLNTQAG